MIAIKDARGYDSESRHPKANAGRSKRERKRAQTSIIKGVKRTTDSRLSETGLEGEENLSYFGSTNLSRYKITKAKHKNVIVSGEVSERSVKGNEITQRTVEFCSYTFSINPY
jgi:hypothetical protein